MKNKLGILVLIWLFGTCISFAQNEINFKPKDLIRVLDKAGITSMSSVEEIILPDSVYKKNNIRGKFFLIKNNYVSQYRYIYVGRVNSCRSGGCSNSNLTQDEEAEYFDYFILFDKTKTIRNLKVFNYQATHGQEITAKGWLKQFIGYNGTSKLQVEKNIDAISGATISVYAITIDVEIKTDILKSIKPPNHM